MVGPADSCTTLSSTARNARCVTERLFLKICMQYNTLETDVEPAPDAESLYCADEIMEIIGRLPMRQRQVVDLRLCGYKYNDIAEELGTSVGNVKNSMFLARKNLKRMLGE